MHARPLTPLTPLDRVDHIDALPDRPTVFAGAARDMPALLRWSDEYLRHTLGDSKPTVRLPDGRLARMKMTDYLAYLATPEQFTSTVGPAYLTDFYVHPTFGDERREALARDVTCPVPRGEGPWAEWISLYAGPAGTTTQLHQDVFDTNTWLAELRGDKLWRLCAPDDIDPDAEVDLFGEHDVRAEVFEAVLRPGDVIYLPPNWWHQVKNLTSTMALSGNFCTIERARQALSESRAFPNEQHRRVWVQTWEAILERYEQAA